MPLPTCVVLVPKDICTELGTICEAVAYSSRAQPTMSRQCHLYGKALLDESKNSLLSGYAYSTGNALKGNTAVAQGSTNSAYNCSAKQQPGAPATATTRGHCSVCVCARVCTCLCVFAWARSVRHRP